MRTSKAQRARNADQQDELLAYAAEHDLTPRWEWRPVGDYQPHNVWLIDARGDQVARGFGKSLSMAIFRCLENHREVERARRKKKIRLLRKPGA